MKRNFLAALLCLMSAMLFGCGGGGSTKATLRGATVVVRIAMPDSARALLGRGQATSGGRAASQRLIPSNTQAVTVTYSAIVTDSTTNTSLVQTKTVAANPSGSQYTATLNDFAQGTPNTIVVLAYDTPIATPSAPVVPVAQGTTTVNVAPGATPPDIKITLQTTVQNNNSAITLQDTTLGTLQPVVGNAATIASGHNFRFSAADFGTKYTDNSVSYFGTTNPSPSTLTWTPVPNANAIIQILTPTVPGTFEFKALKAGSTSVTLTYTEQNQILSTQTVSITINNPGAPTPTHAPVTITGPVVAANAFDVAGDFVSGDAFVLLDDASNFTDRITRHNINGGQARVLNFSALNVGTRLAFVPSQSAWIIMKSNGISSTTPWTGQPLAGTFVDLDVKRYNGTDYVYTLEQSGPSYQVAARDPANNGSQVGGTISLSGLGFTPTNLTVIPLRNQNGLDETDIYLTGPNQIAKVTVAGGETRVNSSFVTGIVPADIAASGFDTRFLYVLTSSQLTVYSTADGSLISTVNLSGTNGTRLAVAENSGFVYLYVLDANGVNAQVESFKLP